MVALHALLTERNVTRAGERIGLSQPAMSAALGKLRRHFGDDLLTRDGARFVLTPLATSLLDQADMALRFVEHTFAARPVFDAQTSTREFSVVMSDYALTVLGGPLLGLLEQRAPNVKLRISPVDPAAVDEGSSALRAVDLMVLPRGYLRDLPSAELYRDSWVGVTATDNDNVGEVVGDHELQTLRWILTYNRPTQFTPPDHHLQLAGIERHVDVVIENFLALPFLLTGTKRIGVLQERLARKLCQAAGVRIVQFGADLPELVEALWWHPSRASDPGHRWLHSLVIDAAATLDSPLGPITPLGNEPRTEPTP